MKSEDYTGVLERNVLPSVRKSVSVPAYGSLQLDNDPKHAIKGSRSRWEENTETWSGCYEVLIIIQLNIYGKSWNSAEGAYQTWEKWTSLRATKELDCSDCLKRGLSIFVIFMWCITYINNNMLHHQKQLVCSIQYRIENSECQLLLSASAYFRECSLWQILEFWGYWYQNVAKKSDHIAIKQFCFISLR